MNGEIGPTGSLSTQVDRRVRVNVVRYPQTYLNTPSKERSFRKKTKGETRDFALTHQKVAFIINLGTRIVWLVSHFIEFAKNVRQLYQ